MTTRSITIRSSNTIGPLSVVCVAHPVYVYVVFYTVHMFALFGGKVDDTILFVNNGSCCFPSSDGILSPDFISENMPKSWS